MDLPKLHRGSAGKVSLLEAEEDHDVNMTLSAIQEGLPLRVIPRHAKNHEVEKGDFVDISRPELFNVLVDHRATATLDEPRAAGQSTEFYPLPACRDYLCDAIGYITSREIFTLRPELPGYEFRDYLQERDDWSDEM
jgi:hypothetical protein